MCIYILKIFFSRTTEPEKLKFTYKLSDIVQNQVCKMYGPLGSGGATIGENVFTCDYIGKLFLKSSRQPLGQKSSNLH
jgi:hypothetical protein